MAGWLSVHRVSTYPELRTKEQMVAATTRAAAEARLHGPWHQVLEAAVTDPAQDAPR